MRLLSSEMPIGAPRASRSTLEHRERPPQQRVVSAAAFTITNCPGAAAAAIAGAAQREHVVVGRQRRVRDHFRGDVDGHRGSILHGSCATFGC